jgi:prepilin-type processing-associated H-X9-DG protein
MIRRIRVTIYTISPSCHSALVMPAAQPHDRSAFTLIELLVTLGIIIILASLLFGGLTAARMKAHSVGCIHNLHQQGIALASWLADHHTYPLAFADRELEPNVGYVTWSQALLPNRKFNNERERDIFTCPAAARPPDLPETNGYEHYGYNAWGLNGPGHPLLGLGGHGPAMIFDGKSVRGSYGPAVQESEVKNPSGVLAIGDAFIGWKEVIQDGHSYIGRSSSARDFYGSSRRAPRRHRNRANIIFTDAHATTLPLPYLCTDSSDEALRLWNIDNEPHRERLAE